MTMLLLDASTKIQMISVKETHDSDHERMFHSSNVDKPSTHLLSSQESRSPVKTIHHRLHLAGKCQRDRTAGLDRPGET